MSLKSDLAENLGMASMHPARRPVPRLEGQVGMKPRCSECMKSPPLAVRTSLMAVVASQNLWKMEWTLSPFSMEMILELSSSLIQTKKFLASLWKIPRASGQWRPHPEERRRVESGSWKRLPPLRSSSAYFSDIPLGLGA